MQTVVSNDQLNEGAIYIASETSSGFQLYIDSTWDTYKIVLIGAHKV